MRLTAHFVAAAGLLWLAVCGAVQVQTPAAELPHPSIAVHEYGVPHPPVVPFADRASVNLDVVRWTAPHKESLKRLADRWGTNKDMLLSLNPNLAGSSKVGPGDQLVLYRREPETISRSVGAPNRGRIEYSAPFPEGDAWVLRTFRPRSYATRETVKTLAQVLTSWRERFPNANPVKLGEFSKRGGGRVRPHKSHRSGRDVDIGYVMLEPDEGHRFVTATAQNLNAPATWGLVQGLLASETVDSVFMAENVQALLLPYAAQSLSPEQQRALFSSLETDARAKKKTKIRAWRGHDDHMHVRFGCTGADLRCGTVAPRKRKRRKKRKRSRSRKKSRKSGRKRH